VHCSKTLPNIYVVTFVVWILFVDRIGNFCIYYFEFILHCIYYFEFISLLNHLRNVALIFLILIVVLM